VRGRFRIAELGIPIDHGESKLVRYLELAGTKDNRKGTFRLPFA
jgi:hypothetical protein